MTFSGLRHPDIHTWIRGTDAIESQAEVACNIRQRIPLFKADESQPTNDIISFSNREHILFDRFIQRFRNKLGLLMNTSRHSTSLECQDNDKKSNKSKCSG